MTSASDRADHLAANRDRWFSDNQANWDDRAALHEASGYGIEELIADPTYLTPELSQDLAWMGEIAGTDVIHLQCHLGTDTVGFARLGARRVVGVDLSGESLRRARIIAERCGVDIEYVQSNVYQAREHVTGDFVLVYTSLGVLCWLPDIAGWARVVASLLRPGGRFVIRDDHPMFMTVGDDVSDGLKIEQPYFEQPEPLTWDDDGSYVEAPEGTPRIQHGVSHIWNHSLGEIVTALIRAGLVVDYFEETPYSAWCAWPDLMVRDGDRWRLRDNPERLPLQFMIAAHRPTRLRQ
ncbi:MAG: class I SAM-dependent methyltransferase [Ancrocorticia sp.]